MSKKITNIVGSNKSKRTRLSLAVSSAILGLCPLLLAAQEVAQNDSDVNAGDKTADVEVIEVTGIRGSINSAQNIKRYADTVKDVITASDIGALPDKSVTEALQRIPGVTIERFASSSDPKHYADEGTGVLVRGLDRVRSEVNGRDAFSANPSGGLSYEDFPAELLGAVEVVKNQTADLISGGISGTVNLITRKPFDSDERLISFNAKANYGDFREEVTPSFSALFSDNWQTSAGKFGFLIAASKSDYETRGDGVGLGNFHSRGDSFVPTLDQWGGITGVDSSSPVDGPALPGQPAGSIWHVPVAIHMSTATNDRKRTGLTSSVQWSNTDETIVATLEHIHSKASLEWNERQIGQAAQGFKSFMGSSQNWQDDAQNGYPLTTEGSFVTSGIALGVSPETPFFYRSRWNHNENTVDDTSFKLTWKPVDRLTIDFDYQHVDAEKQVENYSMSGQTRGNHVHVVSPYFLDMRGSRPTVKFLSDNILTAGWSPNEDWNGPVPNVFLGSGMEQVEHNTAKSDSFKLDFKYELDGHFTSVSAGLYASDKDLKVRDTDYEGWSAIGTPWVQGDRNAAAAINKPELFERVDFSDYFHGEVLQGNVNNFLFPKMDLVKNYAQSLRQGCKDGWHNATRSAENGGVCSGTYVPYEDKPNRIEGPYAAHNISSTNEQRTEFYVRGDFDFEFQDIPVVGNIGLRYVNYQLESTGALVQPQEIKRGDAGTSLNSVMQQPQYKRYYDIAGGQSDLSTVEGTDYTTVLPSLNLSFGIAEDVVIRFGASKALYYPSLVDARNINIINLDYTPILQTAGLDYDDVNNPVVGLDNFELTALSGNPNLEPEEAVNIDLSTEWYFAEAGYITVGLFNKKLDNIIRRRAFDLDVTYGDETYDISAYGPANTGSGTLRGVEFSYSQFYDMLPGVWSGLGLQFNYTYIDQDGLEDPNEVAAGTLGFDENGNPLNDNRNTFRVFSGLPLQGYSDKNFNVIGMYEYQDISFRLAYTWRSDYLLTLRESEEYVPAYAKSSGMMDASLYYTINDHWKVGIEASNLLDTETKTEYQMDQAGTKTQALNFTTDRRFALSVRATF
ncbi:Vitamin B12 transporter BtuB [Pseudoalteromonas sp. CIP111854]|uniref:Vitamin B12 transporter BtuB n=1 Tax=Pseudoalteromonas holothuriae TaxID=2963714 RepID=A0A9W4VR99_9GAMM|nr:TonB-dependent receptor [Pseudoalteromonas sp. CIP111854]CAH9057422.1 Vitamin B12 transporter BtuB [Pseudoalteromonas sp. CIP111854]